MAPGVGVGAIAMLVVLVAPAILTTSVLAAPLAMPAIRARSVLIPGLGTALIAIVVTAPLVAGIVALVNEPDGPSDFGHFATNFTGFLILGYLFATWPYLLIAIPSGFVWAWALRWLFQGQRFEPAA